jgi:ABC-type nitrate/sulfonate/bicarbonate transport system permease component
MTKTIGVESVKFPATSTAIASCRFGTNTTAGFLVSHASVIPLAAVCTRVKFSTEERSGQNGSHFGAKTPHASWHCPMPSRMDSIAQTESISLCCSLIVVIVDPNTVK